MRKSFDTEFMAKGSIGRNRREKRRQAGSLRYRDMEELMVYQHLAPLENELIKSNVKVTYRGQAWQKIVVSGSILTPCWKPQPLPQD